ncbi:MAG: LysR family transcriptional regulator [Aeromonas bestiarum]
MDKHLRQFIEVATHKSVSLAARHMGLSQPTLTHNMKKLEESLGTTLLIRHAGGVTLTAAGELLLTQARVMQRIYDDTLRRLAILRERATLPLRVGTGHAWWQHVLQPVTLHYRAANQSCAINIEVGNHLRLLDLLLGNHIDLFLGHEIHGLDKQYSLIFIPLFTSSDAIFVRAGHPLLGKICSKQDLVNYPSLLITTDEPQYLHLVEDLARKKQDQADMQLNDKIIYTCNSLMTGIDMANTSNAVMPYPDSMKDYFSTFGIVPLNMDEEYNKGVIGIYISREKMDEPHIHTLCQQIQTQVSKHDCLMAAC